MKRSAGMKVLLVLVAVALLAGCASPPKMIRAEQELKAGPNNALIVFLMPMVFPGNIQVWDSEKFIGFCHTRTWLAYVAKPGEHTFLMRDENWQIVKGKVAAGRTYYIKLEGRIGAGAFTSYAGSGTRVSVEVLDPNDRRIKEWKQTLIPVELADESKAEAFEKKNAKAVNKAISNVESGKATALPLTPSGK